jgi:hypothetical protein
VTVVALEPFGFGSGDVQADGEVVGEMITADGNDGRVRDGALEEDDQFRRGCADVDEADAERVASAAARDSRTVSVTSRPALFTQVTMLCWALAELVAMCRLTSRRLPIMPTGS